MFSVCYWNRKTCTARQFCDSFTPRVGTNLIIRLSRNRNRTVGVPSRACIPIVFHARWNRRINQLNIFSPEALLRRLISLCAKRYACTNSRRKEKLPELIWFRGDKDATFRHTRMKSYKTGFAGRLRSVAVSRDTEIAILKSVYRVENKEKKWTIYVRYSTGDGGRKKIRVRVTRLRIKTLQKRLRSIYRAIIILFTY